MQVVYKIDLVFKILYAGLILGVGAIAFMLSGKGIVIPVAAAAILLYLYLAFKRNFKRYRAVRRPFPREWRNILEENSAFYNRIDETGKRRFEKDIRIFLADFNIRGIKGQEVDTGTRVLVAAGIATLLHGRPFREPPTKDGVVIYPGDRFDRDYRTGRGNIAGQAAYRGPLLVTRESLEQGFRDPHDGRNVILHELAHYFDLEDGRADGIPSFDLPSRSISAWKDIIAREWQRVNRGESFLDPYAGVNEAEFFAVATEFFFEKPHLMARQSPELYMALKEFYNIDTLEIFKRGL